MTVTDIVNDLLKYNMITTEAALVLLKAEAEALAAKSVQVQPIQTFPYNPPFKVGDVDWTWDPHRQPIWYTTNTGATLKTEE